jgi:hypothetical protein
MDTSSPFERDADSILGRVSSGRGSGKGGFRRNLSCEKSDVFRMHNNIRRENQRENG